MMREPTRSAAEFLRTKYDFGWEVLDVIISGKSSIDTSNGFELRNPEDVRRFVRSYGYDLENPIEKAEVFGNFHEALNFVRKHFLQSDHGTELSIEIPRRIVELTDITELFLMASMSYPNQSADSQGMLLRNWACSILKVMHTIAHLDKDLRTPHFPEIQKQILDRFYKVIHRDANGSLYLGQKEDDPNRVDLIAFESKPKKSRDSILLKLLHKPENVAEDIFDRVGIRFITPSRLDAIRVVKYLKDEMIVIPPNIKPSRSRNTLVELGALRRELAELPAKGEISEEEIISRLDASTHTEKSDSDNPHSSEYYRAIQFTCRQLIKLVNPLYDDLKEIKIHGRAKGVPENLNRAIERIEMRYIQREIRFFYPFEVQVVDKHSSEENEKGRSAHSEYKKAQVQTALRRVMGPLANVTR